MKERTISVFNLSKSFKQYKKEAGLAGSLRSLIKRESYEIEAVNEVSFDIEQGEFVGFIGPNGAGKTTTLKCLSGLLYPSDGVVNVLGFTPWDRKRDFLMQTSLVMGQKNQLWWDLPAIDSFILNKEIYQIPEEQFRERLLMFVELLELEDVIDVQVRKLSLGQRMKCELLSALLHAPKVLFLDEPTIGLDVMMQKKLRNFFKEFNKRFNTTVMLTSHYMEDVKELCKRVILIDKGRVIYDGELDALVRSYATNKNISFITNRKILKSDLKRFGEVVEHTGHSVVLSVPRDEISTVSAAILKSLPVEDLEIREIALDEVVRGVFSQADGNRK